MAVECDVDKNDSDLFRYFYNKVYYLLLSLTWTFSNSNHPVTKGHNYGYKKSFQTK